MTQFTVCLAAMKTYIPANVILAANVKCGNIEVKSMIQVMSIQHMISPYIDMMLIITLLYHKLIIIVTDLVDFICTVVDSTLALHRHHASCDSKELTANQNHLTVR